MKPRTVPLNKSIINITKAVLYDDDGDIVLENNFAPIQMINGDSLELTWHLDSTGAAVVPTKIDLNKWEAGTELHFPHRVADDPEMDEAIKKWYERL